MRLQTLGNVFKNPPERIFDGFIAVNLLGGVDECNLDRAGLARLGEQRFVLPVRLAHAAAQQIALVGTFVKFLGSREKDARRHFGVGFRIDDETERIDESAATVAEQTPYSTERAQPLLFRQPAVCLCRHTSNAII